MLNESWLTISPTEAGNSKQQSHFQMGTLRALYLVEHHSNRTRQHLEIFLAVVPVGGATGILWIEARDAAKPSTMRSTAPYKKEPSSPNFSSASLRNSDIFKGSSNEIWRRKWQPTPVFLAGESHGWRSLVGYSTRGRKEWDTIERLHFHFPMKEKNTLNIHMKSCIIF